MYKIFMSRTFGSTIVSDKSEKKKEEERIKMGLHTSNPPSQRKHIMC